jgi:hypothetical protein
MRTIAYPLNRIVSGLVRPERLDWSGPVAPRMTDGCHGLEQRAGPIRIRWGRVLVLAFAFLILFGELGAAVSASALSWW